MGIRSFDRRFACPDSRTVGCSNSAARIILDRGPPSNTRGCRTLVYVVLASSRSSAWDHRERSVSVHQRPPPLCEPDALIVRGTGEPTVVHIDVIVSRTRLADNPGALYGQLDRLTVCLGAIDQPRIPPSTHTADARALGIPSPPAHRALLRSGQTSVRTPPSPILTAHAPRTHGRSSATLDRARDALGQLAS